MWQDSHSLHAAREEAGGVLPTAAASVTEVIPANVAFCRLRAVGSGGQSHIQLPTRNKVSYRHSHTCLSACHGVLLPEPLQRPLAH